MRDPWEIVSVGSTVNRDGRLMAAWRCRECKAVVLQSGEKSGIGLHKPDCPFSEQNRERGGQHG